jgi:hypothetical protein
MKLYSVTDWDGIFETCETRKLEALRWWPKPNKHDGLGFKRLAMQREKVELYCAWNLIGDIASKTPRPNRGVLIRSGRPLTAEDLSLMTGFPQCIFEKAFDFFTSPELGWLTVRDLSTENAPNGSAALGSTGQAEPEAQAASPRKSGRSPGLPGDSPAEGREGREGKEGRETAPPPPSFDPVPKGLFRREYEAMLKDAEAEIKRIREAPGSYERTLSRSAQELVAFLMQEKRNGWEGKVRDVQNKPENYVRTRLTQQAQATVTAWEQRKLEIRRVMQGVKT